MSQPQTIKVTCNSCGEESSMSYESAVETALEPDLEEQLLEGTLFEHTCPHCNTTFSVIVPFLYKDDESRRMINLAPDFADTAEVERLFEATNLGDSDVSYKDAGYTLRIVGDPNSLREKILIFKEGFDDRPMEVLKLTIAMEAAQQMGAVPQSVLFQGIEGDNLSFYIVNEGDDAKAVAVNRASYDAIARDMGDVGADTYYITPAWALEQYKKLAGGQR